MAMTAAVKDELSRLDVVKPCCRKAELAALLRFAGGIHLVNGRVVVEAELDTGAAARRVVVLNLAAQPGETRGFSPEAHLEVLQAYASGVRIDVVVADVSHVPDPHGLMSVAHDLGAELVLAPVARDDGSPRHDAVRLAEVFARFMGGRH